MKKTEISRNIVYKTHYLPQQLENTYNKFSGQIEFNKKIYFIPFNSEYLLIYDINSSSFDMINVGLQSGKWWGGVLYNNKIYQVPHNSQNVLVIDIQSKTINLVPLGTYGIQKWQNGVVYNDKIYFIPYNHTSIQEFNPITNQISYYEVPIDKNINKKFTHGVLYNDKLYCIPYDYNYILEFDLNSKSFNIIGFFSGSNKWINSTLIDNKVYQTPYSNDSLLIFDLVNKSITYKQITSWYSFNFVDSVYLQEYNSIILIPQYGSNIVQIDLDTNNIFYFLELENSFKWIRQIQVDNKFYTVPYDQNYFIEFNIKSEYIVNSVINSNIVVWEYPNYYYDQKLNLYLDEKFTKKQSKIISFSDSSMYNQIWNVFEEPFRVEKQKITYKQIKKYDNNEYEYNKNTGTIKLNDVIDNHEIQFQIDLNYDLFEDIPTVSNLYTFVLNSQRVEDRTKIIKLYLVNEDDTRILSDIIINIRDFIDIFTNEWFSLSLDGTTWTKPPLNIGELKGFDIKTFYLKVTIPYKIFESYKFVPKLGNFVLTINCNELPNN